MAPLDTTTLPTSVRLADAMTITGIDSTGQSAGGNVPPPRQVTDPEDLDAELLTLDTDVDTAAPVSPVPDVEAAPELEHKPSRRLRVWRWLNWRDVLAIATFVAVSLCLLLAALLASYLPARRAAGLDPMTVLRHD